MLFDRENSKSYYIHTLWRRDASEEENCDYMMHSHTSDDSRDITQHAVIGIFSSNILTFIVCRATVALDVPRVTLNAGYIPSTRLQRKNIRNVCTGKLCGEGKYFKCILCFFLCTRSAEKSARSVSIMCLNSGFQLLPRPYKIQLLFYIFRFSYIRFI